MSDIGDYYRRKREEAAEIREKLREEGLTPEERRKLEARLEVALYVGD